MTAFSYGAMKAALLFYMKSLARHVAQKGIRPMWSRPHHLFSRRLLA